MEKTKTTLYLSVKQYGLRKFNMAFHLHELTEGQWSHTGVRQFSSPRQWKMSRISGSSHSIQAVSFYNQQQEQTHPHSYLSNITPLASSVSLCPPSVWLSCWHFPLYCSVLPWLWWASPLQLLPSIWLTPACHHPRTPLLLPPTPAALPFVSTGAFQVPLLYTWLLKWCITI